MHQNLKNATKSIPPQLLFFTNSLRSLSHSSSPLNPTLKPNKVTIFPLIFHHYCHSTTFPSYPLHQIPSFRLNDVVHSVKEWFQTQNYASLDRVFEILSNQDEVDEVALDQLGLRLTESVVLEILRYGNAKNDVLSCLKFFDWAGRLSGFHHTRATFHAIFKILSKAKLMPLMLDFLDNYMKFRFINHKLGYGFYPTLVMGYSVAGKPLVALQLFGRMRFQGIDLDDFTYHVLLNSLVEECCFDAVECIANQISIRGFTSHVTHSIVVKSFCKQRLLDEAEGYLRDLFVEGECGNGSAVGVLVDAFCREGLFEKAGQLVEEFRGLGVTPMEPAYDVWLRNLIQSGNVDLALGFLQHKKSLETYVPEVFQYNALLCRLLKENRLKEACDLLLEMMEGGISPDKITMNAALCFFCKAGMVDVALDLYNCKSEFGLSPTTMTCNYLINSLCGEGKVDEAYSVLKNCTDQGYIPGKRTFSILTHALCKEGKLDMMKELVDVALERNIIPSDSMFDKFISAMCRARRLEDGYLIHGKLNRMNRVATKSTYSNLIHGFNKINKGDVAARLLIEMQDKGHIATRTLFRAVIRSLCDMENPENQFFNLLEMQLSHHEPNCQIYNFFIDGAGHAKKPNLARETFEMMLRSGIKPNLSSDILMLQSYLKSEKISDAFNFFNDLCHRRTIGRKLCNTMVVGLCKGQKLDSALTYFKEMKGNEVVPSIECYEVLIQSLCSNKDYDTAIDLVKDFEKTGRHITSFIGNIFLLHSFKSDELYNAWLRSREEHDEGSSGLSILGQIIGAFSGRLRVSQEIDSLEDVIEQCFPLDLYTYNMLLRRLSMINIDYACELFDRICQNGYEPNQWTYDILVHGLFKHGRTEEARRWVDIMFRRGFDPTDRTKRLM
ncbi:pentatricopeptide repeat-containing protein At1g71210, mitochondrial [Mercurialis annua]|uniref:pentatricopeptide repeat-containing protein At1g71210, mitochondrial n=1 Tax=Mercurialis annua TaxID=3986 RepID=UPI00215DE55E|nr:pentatricopeptide repeat-containing protein At1g71210, mitochondrial [Mercurialis annua]